MSAVSGRLILGIAASFLDSAASELFNVVLALLKIVFVMVQKPEDAAVVNKALAKVPTFGPTLQALCDVDQKEISSSIRNLVMVCRSALTAVRLFCHSQKCAFVPCHTVPVFASVSVQNRCHFERD